MVTEGAIATALRPRLGCCSPLAGSYKRCCFKAVSAAGSSGDGVDAGRLRRAKHPVEDPAAVGEDLSDPTRDDIMIDEIAERPAR